MFWEPGSVLILSYCDGNLNDSLINRILLENVFYVNYCSNKYESAAGGV